MSKRTRSRTGAQARRRRRRIHARLTRATRWPRDLISSPLAKAMLDTVYRRSWFAGRITNAGRQTGRKNLADLAIKALNARGKTVMCASMRGGEIVIEEHRPDGSVVPLKTTQTRTLFFYVDQN